MKSGNINPVLMIQQLVLFVDHLTRFLSEDHPAVWAEFSEKYPDDIENFVRLGKMIK